MGNEINDAFHVARVLAISPDDPDCITKNATLAIDWTVQNLLRNPAALQELNDVYDDMQLIIDENRDSPSETVYAMANDYCVDVEELLKLRDSNIGNGLLAQIVRRCRQIKGK